MISVMDRSDEGFMEVRVDEPDYKDRFFISAEIFKRAYSMDGGDHLRSVARARMNYFMEHPDDKMAWDSYLVVNKI